MEHKYLKMWNIGSICFSSGFLIATILNMILKYYDKSEHLVFISLNIMILLHVLIPLFLKKKTKTRI